MSKREFDEFDDLGPEGQSVDIKPYFQLLLKNWKKILLWALCGALFGIMIGFSTPKTYTSRAVVAPELTTRANTAGLSTLASLAGINMNTLTLTDAMHPDMYPEIIRSTDFFIKLFDMPVDVRTKDTLIHTDLYDYMVNYNRTAWWNYVLGVPRFVLNGIKSLFVEKDEFDEAEGHSSVDHSRLTKQQEMVVKALSNSVTASVEKRTYVLSLKATMQDPVIAAQLVNAIVENLQQFVVDYRTEKERENLEYYKKIYEETRADYLSAQQAYARYADSNAGSISKTSQIKQQQLQNEAQLRYQLYNQISQHLLASRVKVQQESPVLVVIQQGIAPHNGKPSKVKLAILWFMLGAVICIGWICWQKG